MWFATVKYPIKGFYEYTDDMNVCFLTKTNIPNVNETVDYKHFFFSLTCLICMYVDFWSNSN